MKSGINWINLSCVRACVCMCGWRNAAPNVLSMLTELSETQSTTRRRLIKISAGPRPRPSRSTAPDAPARICRDRRNNSPAARVYDLISISSFNMFIRTRYCLYLYDGKNRTYLRTIGKNINGSRTRLAAAAPGERPRAGNMKLMM